jgi:hypothetical protein
MVVWNSGSVATHIGNMYGWSVIGTLSGATLNDMVIQEINFMNTYTNDNTSSDSIAEKYQPSVIDLVQSKVLLTLESQQGGIDTVSLGDLSVSQGAGGGSELAKQLRADAILRLKELGRYTRYRRVISG